WTWASPALSPWSVPPLSSPSWPSRCARRRQKRSGKRRTHGTPSMGAPAPAPTTGCGTAPPSTRQETAMSTDEYEAITEAEWKVLATTEITHLTDEEKDYLPRAWDEWTARVKRDAAREALAAAEHRATRAEAQSAIRGRAVVIYRERARQAEAERDEWRQTALDERGAALDLLEQIKARDKRIQAVQHLIDQADTAGDWTVTCSRLQWAIDG